MTKANFAIAAVQSVSFAGDVARNVRHHIELVQAAADRSANVIVFPELSLTGYEPSLAPATALAPDDQDLGPLQRASDLMGVTIIAGCPLKTDGPKPYIASLIVRPGTAVSVYRKRFLDPSEEPYFIAYPDVVVCSSHDHRIGIAICADIGNPAHPADVADRGADVYAAGVAMTPNGIESAEESMSGYARRYGFLAIMANHGSDTGGFSIAGRSGAWGEKGKRLAQAPDAGEFLVLAEATEQGWRGRLVKPHQ